jgi:oligopeptide transport system permease protein
MSGGARELFARVLAKPGARVALGVLVTLVVACALGPLLTSHRYDVADLSLGATAPSRAHWLGTDLHGRDLLARLLVGGRVSFAVASLGALVSLSVGVVWGATAGYAGGRLDRVLMRVVDGLYTFPFLVLVLVVSVFFGRTDGALFRALGALARALGPVDDAALAPVFRVGLVAFTLGSVSWLTMARVVRAEVRALRRAGFVEAAELAGLSRVRVVRVHLVPNVLGPVLAYASLLVPEIMMTEAFLSFLGLGTEEPLSSWGLLAASGAESMALAPWLLAAPSVALAATLASCNRLGDALAEALDVRRGGAS